MWLQFCQQLNFFTEKPLHDILKFCLLLVSLGVVIQSEVKSGTKGFSKIPFFVFFANKNKRKETNKNKKKNKIYKKKQIIRKEEKTRNT